MPAPAEPEAGSTPPVDGAAEPEAVERFVASPPAAGYSSIGRLAEGEAAWQRACQLWSRLGEPNGASGKPIFHVTDTSADQALSIRVTSDGFLEVETSARARPEPADRERLLGDLRAFLDTAEPRDCEVVWNSGSSVFVMGVREGKPFQDVAPFDRALAHLLAQPFEPGAPESYSDWGLHRDDALVALWLAGSDAERAAHADELPKIQEAARRMLDLNPMEPAWLSDVGRQGYCELSDRIARGAKLDAREDRRRVRDFKKRFCRRR